eukprot:187463-Alexandrium_andersonii.AAC.1
MRVRVSLIAVHPSAPDRTLPSPSPSFRNRPSIPYIPGLRELYVFRTGRHHQLGRQSCASDVIPECAPNRRRGAA